jgi:nicotinamidase-related amidase
MLCPLIMTRTLSIHPRYYRWHVDPGIDWTEANTGYDFLDWQIPIERVALVSLDVWDSHYLQETRDRIHAITAGRIAPLLKAARESGLSIIHAPGWEVALKHPNWVRLIDESEVEWPVHDEWPPKDFVDRTGPYTALDYPVEPRQPELDQRRKERKFHPLAEPIGDEPVVANGEELHRYCKEKELLHLVYFGFNTNYCIVLNDYGTVHMSNRGYSVILLRDCTTGMESFETLPQLGQTRTIIQHLEMSKRFTLTAPELIAALRE